MLLRRPSVRLILLFLFYFTYLIIGASIFSAIEAPEEAVLTKQLKHSRRKFLKEHECVQADRYPRPAVHVCKQSNYNQTSTLKEGCMRQPFLGNRSYKVVKIMRNLGYKIAISETLHTQKMPVPRCLPPMQVHIGLRRRDLCEPIRKYNRALMKKSLRRVILLTPVLLKYEID